MTRRDQQWGPVSGPLIAAAFAALLAGPANAEGLQPPAILEVPLPAEVIEKVDATAEARGETAAEWLGETVGVALAHPDAVVIEDSDTPQDRIDQALDSVVLDVPLPHSMVVAVDQAAAVRKVGREEWLAAVILQAAAEAGDPATATPAPPNP